jgi:hypothetical protein
MKRTVSILFSFLLLAGLILGLMQPVSAMGTAPQAIDKIEITVLQKIAATGSSDFVLEMAEKADLSAAYAITDWVARGDYVVDILKATAERTQKSVIALLEKEGLAYQSFFSGNEVHVYGGDNQVVLALAALPEVGHIRYPRTVHVNPSIRLSPVTVEAKDEVNALDWGIVDTNADEFWTTFGNQGADILVANIDTGVQWDHSALDQAYKCAADPSNAACWLDPNTADCTGTNGGPCDNNGHGTHTMGTMVGDDDPTLTYQVGMAPDATWIACKGCATNSCSDSDLTTCADWILQPGGSTANRPQIVNNSWGGGSNDNWYESYVTAWRAAGIFPAFSAGNSGPTCGSIGSPGDYQVSFGTANHQSSRAINPDSSRGPSAFGHDPYTKPNLSAPGTSICSSVPGNAWSCGYSGTSMAAPHVAGAVALLWSCDPDLAGQIDETFQLLQNSADTPGAAGCGTPPDGQGNYDFGYGYLNVLAAGNITCSGAVTGTLEGTVTDDLGNPVEGADVSAAIGLLNGAQIQATTGPDGSYSMTLAAGTYNVTASKYGFTPHTVNGVEIADGVTTTQDFELIYVGEWTPGPTLCFDLTRFDAEYAPATGLVYVLGGRNDTETVGAIYSLDPATGDCADTGAVMPNPVSNYTIALLNDGDNELLCTFGGRASSGTPTLDVQCYNPLSNTVETVTTLPTAYTGFTPGGVAVVNNQAYIFGGFRNTATPYELTRTDRYDPVANSFTQVGDLSLGRAYIYTAVVDGAIYAFGGTVFDGTNLVAQTRAEVMADPGGAGTWDNAAVTDLPAAYDEGQAFGFDTTSTVEGMAGLIVLAGGGAWPGESADVLTYDTVNDSYDTTFPDLIEARRNHAGVFVPDNTPAATDGLPGMWVLGGRSGSDAPPYRPAEFFALRYTGANVAPVAVDDAYDMDEDTVLTIPAPGVLDNDNDADGDDLTADLVSGPAVGTLTLNADGSFTYTPVADYFGVVTFTYEAYDGTDYSNIATVTITIADIAEAQLIHLPIIIK